MFDEIGNFLITILPGLIGGVLSGGLIVGWIEIKRYQREKEQWDLADKKIELIKLSASHYYLHWDPEPRYVSDQEKIRIYESGLNGKIKNWYFFAKFEIANLTNQDILAHDISLVIPQPRMVKPHKENKKYFDGYKEQIVRRYNLMTKETIEDINFPILLPANSKSGIVFVGDIVFDYPNIVEEVPSSVEIRIKFDGNEIIDEDFLFSLANNLAFMDEVDFIYTEERDHLHWIPYMEKNGISYGLPF